MHFMVFASGRDLAFHFSNCGSEWKTATFKQGFLSVELDVVRAGLVLDCLGCRVDSKLGTVWHISRDDMNSIDILNVCRSVCTGRNYTSLFDLTAMVIRAVCAQLSYTNENGLVDKVAAEVTCSFFSNADSEKGNA